MNECVGTEDAGVKKQGLHTPSKSLCCGGGGRLVSRTGKHIGHRETATGEGTEKGKPCEPRGQKAIRRVILASLFAEINTIQHELLSLISSKHERISPSRSVFNSIPASEKMLPMLHYSSPLLTAVLMPFSPAYSGVPPCKSSLFIEY